jgi:hypothetical protein
MNLAARSPHGSPARPKSEFMVKCILPDRAVLPRGEETGLSRANRKFRRDQDATQLRQQIAQGERLLQRHARRQQREKAGVIPGQSARHEYDRNAEWSSPHAPDEIEPGQSGHLMIGDQSVKGVRAKGFPSRFAVFGAMGNVTGATQSPGHDLPNFRVIVDEEDSSQRRSPGRGTRCRRQWG